MLVDFCKHYFLISVLASERLKCVLTKIHSNYISLQNSDPWICILQFNFTTIQVYTINFSSDDEIDILLHGTPEQKRKMCRRNSNANKDSSSEDDFEKEMNAELNGQIKEIERRRGSVSGILLK